MDFGEVCAIASGSVLVVLVVWNLAARTAVWRKRGISVLRKRLSQGVIAARPAGTNSVNLSACAGIILLTAANILACVFGVSSRNHLARRVAAISLFNLVSLMAGGRTNLLADSILGVSLQSYGTVHRWLGRICVIQALLHAGLHMETTTIWTSIPCMGVSESSLRSLRSNYGTSCCPLFAS